MRVLPAALAWAAAAAVAAATAPAAGADAPVVVGAIRWDAYWGKPGERKFDDPNYGIVTRTTTYDMSPAQWHYRVPFFGQEINDTAVTVDGDSPEVMGQELEYASTHGINFWSFCNYPLACNDYHPPESDCPGIQCCADNAGLSYAWKQYLQHPNRSLVNFTLLLQPGSWFPTYVLGGNETFEEELARYVSYFRMPEYQTVLGGRPLVFMFGQPANITEVLALRFACKTALGVEPYVVSMNNQQAPGAIDAQSSYGIVSAPTPAGAPFAESIFEPSLAHWESRKAAGVPIVPTVSAGWDPRPRYWDGPTPCPWGNVSNAYTVDPTLPELENFTRTGVEWVASNSDVAEARVLMLSAWNEHDEGHWIAPALDKYGGAEKLQAVKRGIDSGMRTARRVAAVEEQQRRKEQHAGAALIDAAAPAAPN